MLGGPAWTRVPDGQWYLHLFASEQPHLNWASREVRDDFLHTLRFWGVSCPHRFPVGIEVDRGKEHHSTLLLDLDDEAPGGGVGGRSPHSSVVSINLDVRPLDSKPGPHRGVIGVLTSNFQDSGANDRMIVGHGVPG